MSRLVCYYLGFQEASAEPEVTHNVKELMPSAFVREMEGNMTQVAFFYLEIRHIEGLAQTVHNQFRRFLFYYYNCIVQAAALDESQTRENLDFVKEAESAAMRHVIGQTESIDFCANDLGIETAYFTGVHFEQATDYELERNKLPEGKFNKTEIVVDNLDKIEEP